MTLHAPTPQVRALQTTWARSILVCLGMACCLLLWDSPSVAKKRYTAKDIILFKQVGYNEAQILKEVAAKGQLGNLRLSSSQVKTLMKHGFQLAFLKKLGLAKPSTGPSSKPTSVRAKQEPRIATPRQSHAKKPKKQAPPTTRRTAPPRPEAPRVAKQKQRPQPRNRRAVPKPPLPPLPRELGPLKPLPKIAPHPNVYKLIPYLQSGNYRQRVQAVRLLYQLGTAAYPAMPALLKQLQLPAVQQFGIQFIVTAKYKQFVIQALGRMGPYAHPALFTLLSWMHDSQLRPTIAKVLPQIVDDPRRVKTQLLYTLQKRTSGPGWSFAVEQLGRLGQQGQFATPWILPIFSLPTVYNWHGVHVVTTPLKTKACRTLAAIGSTHSSVFWTLQKGLLQSGVKAAATRTLHRLFYNLNDPKIRALWTQVLQQTQNMHGVALAANVLASSPTGAKEALPALLQLAQSLPNNWKTQKARIHVLKALGKLGPLARAATPMLFAYLRLQPFQKVAKSALDSIIQKPKKHVPLFAAIMRDPRQTQGHLYVLRRLLKATTAAKKSMLPSVIPFLEWHKKSNPDARLQAARIVHSLGQDALSALPAIQRALMPQKGEHSTEEFRALLLQTIGNLGPKALSSHTLLLVALSRGKVEAQSSRWALSKVVTRPLLHLSLYSKILGSKGLLPSKHYIAGVLARLKLAPMTFKKEIMRTVIQAFKLWNNQKLLPTSLQIGGYIELAQTQLQQSSPALAWKALKASIQLGYDDFLTLLTSPLWQRWHKNPTFQTLYSSIKIRQGDRHELMWLWSELHTTHHETNMMMIENMNRADSAATAVPQSKIPIRLTQSYGVRLHRNKLSQAQLDQKMKVLLSDIRRRSHNTTMMMINNMGGKAGRWALQRRQMQRLLSQKIAKQRAKARQQRVNQRKFKLAKNPKVWVKGLPLKSIPKHQLSQRNAYIKQSLDTANRLFQRARYPQAVLAYSKVIALSPKHLKALLGRGLSYINSKQYKQAIQDFNQTVKLAPNNPAFWLYRGLGHFFTKNLKQAIRDFSHTIKLNPKLEHAYNGRGASHFRLKQYQQALLNFVVCLKLKPKNQLYLANAAYVLGKLGRFREAVAAWKKASTLGPNEPFVAIVGAYLTLTDPNPVWMRVERTLEWLEKGLKGGFKNLYVILEEPAFASFQRLPYFRYLMRKYAE